MIYLSILTVFSVSRLSFTVGTLVSRPSQEKEKVAHLKIIARSVVSFFFFLVFVLIHSVLLRFVCAALMFSGFQSK